MKTTKKKQTKVDPLSPTVCANFVETLTCKEFEEGSCKYNHDTQLALQKQKKKAKKQRQLEAKEAKKLLLLNDPGDLVNQVIVNFEVETSKGLTTNSYPNLQPENPNLPPKEFKQLPQPIQQPPKI